jgi:hypothetical protein
MEDVFGSCKTSSPYGNWLLASSEGSLGGSTFDELAGWLLGSVAKPDEGSPAIAASGPRAGCFPLLVFERSQDLNG